MAAMAATLTIWIRDPMAEWGYELAVFGIAIGLCVQGRRMEWSPAGVAMAVIAAWGFLDLATGATVYRYATLNAALRFAALAATAFVAPVGLSRRVLLKAFVWFALVVSILSVVAYYTSWNKVLWVFPSEYPDVWGPFLSRNNFAAFLELAFPVALWLAIPSDRPAAEHRAYIAEHRAYMWIAAALLAAGIASASRAGAALLVAETAAVFVLRPGSRRMMPRFAAAAALFIAIAGAAQLAGRLFEPDPLRYRREMARSALAMIRERPWVGFGLGTFATVYPQYATFDAGAAVDHAHNDWLEWTSEGGVGFLAAWGVIAAAMFKRARRSIWAIGVPAVMLHALVDYPFARFGVSAWIFLLIGMREVPRERH